MTMNNLQTLAEMLDGRKKGSMHTATLQQFSDGSGSISAFDTSTGTEIWKQHFENEAELNSFLFGKFPAAESNQQTLAKSIAELIDDELENGFTESFMFEAAKLFRSDYLRTESLESFQEKYPSISTFIDEQTTHFEKSK